MPAELKSASHGRTMVLTISNQDHRNALGPEIYAAGVEALNAADSVDLRPQRVAVVRVARSRRSSARCSSCRASIPSA